MKKAKILVFIAVLTVLFLGLSVASAANVTDDAPQVLEKQEPKASTDSVDMPIKNVKKDVKTHIITNDTISNVFSKQDVSPYNDYGFNSLLLGDDVDDGDVLDFQGTVRGNYNLTINKAVNITSSTNDAIIELDTNHRSLTGNSPGNHFIIDIRGSYTNMTNVNFCNTQIFVYNTSYVSMDNITSVSDGYAVGGGVGATSVREGSEFITVKNSYFYVKDNGGSTVFTLSRAQYCNVDNCTFEGYGCGNIFYLNYFNTWSDCGNDYNNITNNVVIGGSGGISIPMIIDGKENLVKNNTVDQINGGANCTFIGNNVKKYVIARNATYINNTISEGRSSISNCLLEDNIIGGLLEVNGSVLKNNIINANVRMLGLNGQLINNTITNGVNITKNNNSIVLNNISGSISVSSSNNIIKNNSLFTSDDYTITVTKAGRNNVITDNYLRTVAVGGDDTVSCDKTRNTVADNTPVSNAKTIEISDETYSNYFNGEGFIDSTEITDFSTIILNGEFYAKRFNIENKSVIIQGSDSTLIECIITTNNDAHVDIRNVTMINENTTNVLIFNSSINSLQNSTINVNSNRDTQPIIISGNQINIKNNDITFNSKSDDEAYAIYMNSSRNNILNNRINTNSRINNIIYLNGSMGETDSNLIQNNSICAVGENVNVVTLENSNFNIFYRNNISINATGNVYGFYLKNGEFNENNITQNNINMESENAVAIKLSDNNYQNSVVNTYISVNIINSHANNNSVIVQTTNSVKSLTINNNTFNSIGEKSIATYLEGEDMNLYDNFIICQSNSICDDYYDLDSTAGMVFINTTNTRVYKQKSGTDYCNNVTNGYAVKMVNCNNMLVEEQVITSNLNKAMVLINSSNNIINGSYIKSEKFGGEEAVLEVDSYDNQYISNTPEIVYLTDDNYDTYFTDNILNYKYEQSQLPYTHIIIDGDLHDKTMQFDYKIVVDNPDNHTLYDCKIIYNAPQQATILNIPLHINRYSNSFNNLHMISNNQEFVIKCTGVDGMTLNNSNVYHENHDMKTHTIIEDWIIDIQNSNITTIGPEIETDDNTPSTVAVIGKSIGVLNFTNITVKYNSYDNKGFLSGIYSTEDVASGVSYFFKIKLDIVGRVNAVGIKGSASISASEIFMNANNIIGYVRVSRANLGINMTLTANNSITAISGKYAGQMNYIMDSNFILNSNDTAILMDETLGNYTIQNTTATINAKNITIIRTENSTIIISSNCTFNTQASEVTNIMTSKNDTLTITSSNFNINSSIISTLTVNDSTKTRINNNTFILNSPQDTPPIILNTNDATIANNYIESKNFQGNTAIQNNGENIIENNTPNNNGEYRVKISTNKDNVVLGKENTIKINVTNVWDEEILGTITALANNQTIPVTDNTITWNATRETFNPPEVTFTNTISSQEITKPPTLRGNTIINNTTINIPNTTDPRTTNTLSISGNDILLINNTLLNTPIFNSATIYIYNSTLNGSYYGNLHSILYVDEDTTIGENFKAVIREGNIIYPLNIFTNNKRLLEILEENGVEPLNNPKLTVTYTDPEGKYATTTITKTFNTIEANTNITLEPVNVNIGEITTITATVIDQDGQTVNTGRVAFKVNGKILRDDTTWKVIYIDVTDGTASIDYANTTKWDDTTTIQAIYMGTVTQPKAESDTINPAVTTPEEEEPEFSVSDVTTTAGSEVTVTVTTKNLDAGKVVLKVNGKTVKATDGKLYAKTSGETTTFTYTVPKTLKAGEYSIKAVYTSGASKLDAEGVLRVE